MSLRAMAYRVWRVIGFLIGPAAIVGTAVILAGTPSRPSDQGQADPNLPQHVEGVPATQQASAFH